MSYPTDRPSDQPEWTKRQPNWMDGKYKGELMRRFMQEGGVRPARRAYVVGSLTNPAIPEVASELRRTGVFSDVFDDWYGAGPNADDHWKAYNQSRDIPYTKALRGPAATMIYNFDKQHLDAASDVILVCPAGRSGHLELGYAVGMGKRTYILLEAGVCPKWDVMYNFAGHVVESLEELGEAVRAG